MAPLPKRLKDLCTPAFLYFVISIIGLIVVVFQLISNNNPLGLGSFSSHRVPNLTLMIIVKLIYILFWTWILNLICKNGYSSVSWLLVLIPFFLFFSLMFVVREGLTDKNKKNIASSLK